MLGLIFACNEMNEWTATTLCHTNHMNATSFLNISDAMHPANLVENQGKDDHSTSPG